MNGSIENQSNGFCSPIEKTEMACKVYKTVFYAMQRSKHRFSVTKQLFLAFPHLSPNFLLFLSFFLFLALLLQHLVLSPSSLQCYRRPGHILKILYLPDTFLVRFERFYIGLILSWSYFNIFQSDFTFAECVALVIFLDNLKKI